MIFFFNRVLLFLTSYIFTFCIIRSSGDVFRLHFAKAGLVSDLWPTPRRRMFLYTFRHTVPNDNDNNNNNNSDALIYL